VSKPVTAVATLALVEDGLLDLEERAFDILDHIEPVGGETIDSRYREITVRQLLHHSGGGGTNGDQMHRFGEIAERLGTSGPLVCTDVIRYALGVLPLAFEPGTKYAYSNFGYCMLGRIIEEKSGQSYEEYVKERVLTPMGITRMQIGGTLLQDRVEGEVRYYWSPKPKIWPSMFPEGPRQVPLQYGGISVPLYDAPGGWIGSTIDLLRFTTSLDGSKPPVALEPDTVELMLSRHDPPLTNAEHFFYGMGWQVYVVTREAATWSHSGAFWGALALLIRTHDGLVIAVLFNSGVDDLHAFMAELHELVWQGVREVVEWPSHDLFPRYGY
jgi:N-acyl-D-amino-acid deacylase